MTKKAKVSLAQADALLEMLENGWIEEAKATLRKQIEAARVKALASGKIEVEIKTFPEDEPNVTLVGAAVGDHFAVCPPTLRPRVRTRWQIIHRPSGLTAASQIRRKSDAIIAAKALDEIELDWSSETPMNGASRDVFVRCREIGRLAQAGLTEELKELSAQEVEVS